MQKSLFPALLVALLLGSYASADDWTQFRGTNRDGKSAETGLLRKWPEAGPKLLWTAPGCGPGYGSPAVAGGLIYANGDLDGNCCLMVFDLDGRPKAKIAYAKAVEDQFPGDRSTPTIVGGAIYVSNPAGVVACIDAETLKIKWTVNAMERFKGVNPEWKYADSPLLDGNNVICKPGGPDATIVALDKETGNTVWTSKGLGEKGDFSSCIKMTVDGVPMIVTQTAKALVGIDARDGHFLWRYARPASDTANVPTPVFDGRRVFAASGYGVGGGAVDLKADSNGVTAGQAWETKDMNCHHGGYVLVDGHLYGNNGNGWACIEWKTGQTKYKAPGVGKGCVVYADGMLYCMHEKGGKVGLVRATPEGHEIVSQFSIPPGGKGSSWAHPAISNGRLYIRHGDFLYSYDIKDQSAGTKEGPKAKPAN